MCILFIYDGSNDNNNDYSLIVASNRDEYYDRPALNAAPWVEDINVIGGRDLEKGREGGAWLALSPTRARLGILLNITGSPKQNAKGRGNIVADFVKTTTPIEDYLKTLEPYAKEFNDFNIVTIEIGKTANKIHSFSNITNDLLDYHDSYLAFGNSLPDAPYKKVMAGREKFSNICSNNGKVDCQNNLIDELVELLRWNDKHLPDPELKRRCPDWYDRLSSVYVHMPEGRYGTRTHSLILVTKTGHIDFVEITMQPPIDPMNPNWHKTHMQYNL